MRREPQEGRSSGATDASAPFNTLPVGFLGSEASVTQLLGTFAPESTPRSQRVSSAVVERRAVARHHVRPDALAPLLVGDADDGGLRDVGVRLEGPTRSPRGTRSRRPR